MIRLHRAARARKDSIVRIITRKQLLSLPENILYSHYEPCNFGNLQIKGESIRDIDFYSQSITDAIDCDSSGEFADILFAAQETGRSFKMDFYCESRDGMFDSNETLFAVWEKDDIEQLIKRLQEVSAAQHRVHWTENGLAQAGQDHDPFLEKQ